MMTSFEPFQILDRVRKWMGASIIPIPVYGGDHVLSRWLLQGLFLR